MAGGRNPPVLTNFRWFESISRHYIFLCGISSVGLERNLAMVEVTSSNLVCRLLPVRQVGKAHDSDSCIRWFKSITGNYLDVGELVDPVGRESSSEK